MKSARRTFLKDLARAGLWVPVAGAILTKQKKARAQEVVPSRSRNSAGGSSLSAKTLDWANRVVTNGFARPSNATLSAVDTWHLANVAAGIDTKYIWASVIGPGSAGEVITPFYKTAGTDPGTFQPGHPLTPSINGINFAPDGGLVLTTGLNASTIVSTSGAGLVVYNYSQASALSSSYCGGTDNAFTFSFVLTFDASANHTTFECFGVASAGNNYLTYPGKFIGWISGQRSSTIEMSIYQASSGHAHAAIASTVTPAGSPSGNSGQLDLAQLSGLGPACQSTISFFGVTSGFTSAQDTAAYNAVQAMRTSFGGGFV